jgi:hypothetical protein
VQFVLDGVNLGQEDTAAPYAISWDTTGVTNGAHTLTAIARDTASNMATSTPISVTVANVSDVTPPTAAITFPTDGSRVARRSTVTITATASDNVGVLKVEFYVNGGLLSTDTTAPYAASWRVPNARGRTYSLQTKAYDAAGNVGSSSVVNVTSQ